MSTTASNDTLEARELSLVGKVELRMALAESDAKLESMLKTYLPPLLLKLASDFASVRNKVKFSTVTTELHAPCPFCVCYLISTQIDTLCLRSWLISSVIPGHYYLSAYQYEN